MPDRIRLLPDSVANQIAAGEVIQRPASVIKELVENAVDAGADDIRIIVRDAGRTLIQVIDNGIGMSETDTRMAFERHATSKIRSASDLSQLVTMGFRGEALPSICAIAQVEVRSRTKDANIGTHLIIAGSKVESQSPDVCEQGTNIMVKNLFFNVPARRKFLKSDNVELSNIMREFERLALVNPALKMSIDTGGKTIELRKGTFLQRIGDIWKGSLSEQLIPVQADTPTVKISGFISRPEFARRRNALQFFLVNGRNMRHPYFKKAVLNCYNGLVAPDTMPCFFIKFDVDPASIDVNIHPTKDEIKFEEESVIWSILSAAVKASLGKNTAVPTIDFETDNLPVEQIVSTPTPDPAFPAYEIPEDYNPFASAAHNSPKSSGQRDAASGNHRNPATNWEKLYDGFMRRDTPRQAESVSRPSPLPHIADETASEATAISFQIDDKYIVTPGDRGGLVIIDQYRAHLKILFERLLKRLEGKSVVSQTLLFPEPLEISPEEVHPLEQTIPTMHELGLLVEKEGDEYVVTGVPPGVTSQAAVEIVARVVESALEGSSEETTDAAVASLQVRVALVMARSMAVKRGRALSDEERQEIIKDLFLLPDPSLTPSGRRIYTLLDVHSIEKLLP